MEGSTIGGERLWVGSSPVWRSPLLSQSSPKPVWAGDRQIPRSQAKVSESSPASKWRQGLVQGSRPVWRPWALGYAWGRFLSGPTAPNRWQRGFRRGCGRGLHYQFGTRRPVRILVVKL